MSLCMYVAYRCVWLSIVYMCILYRYVCGGVSVCVIYILLCILCKCVWVFVCVVCIGMYVCISQRTRYKSQFSPLPCGPRE